jgi:protease I
MGWCYNRLPVLEALMNEAAPPLAGRRVAVLVEDGFDERDLVGAIEALRLAGATVTVVGATAGGQSRDRRGQVTVVADLSAGAARMRLFDALLIPGGYAPDRMRMRHAMVDLAREAMETGKIVAAICHGPQLLISADALRGRTLTCWPSIAVDVKNAGGLYVDKPVVEDGNLITSRKPDDVPVFVEAIVRALIRTSAGRP